MGQFYSIDHSLLMIENCPGQILTIQSSLKPHGAYDEDSWVNFFLKHGLKISMTVGLLGTGIY